MERKKKVVITGGSAVILFFAVSVIMSKNTNASTYVASRESVEDNSSTSSVVTTTANSPTVTTAVTSSPKAKTTTKTTKVDNNDSSKPEETTTTVTTIIETDTKQYSNIATTAGKTWSEYYVETYPKGTTKTTTAASIVKDSEEATTSIADTTVEKEESKWDGPVLNSYVGIVSGPSGNETYYNLNMSGVISNMKSIGYDYEYWVRDDGVKMYGDYVMCAADLSTRPKGTIVETSLGDGIVCDTGGFVSWDPDRLDIATTW